MRISNKDNFPQAVWLEEPEPVGTIGGQSLLKLGREYEASGEEYMLVARGDRRPYFAVPIYELQGQSQDPIVFFGEDK
jgi:hypothetical protein